MTGPVSEELLSAYFDDEVTLEERALVEQWLAESPAARSMLVEFSQIRQQLQQLPVTSLSKDLVPTELVHTNVSRTDQTASVPAASVPLVTVRSNGKGSNWKREWLAAGIGSLATALTLVLAVGSPFESHSVHLASGRIMPAGAHSGDMAAGSMPGLENFDVKDQRSFGKQEAILAQRDRQPEDLARARLGDTQQVLLREKQAGESVHLGFAAGETPLSDEEFGMGGGGMPDSRANDFERFNLQLHPLQSRSMESAEDKLRLSDEPLLTNTISREPLDFPGAAPALEDSTMSGAADGLSDETRALSAMSEKSLERHSLQFQPAPQSVLRFKKSAPFEVGAVVRYLSPDDPQVGVVEFQVLDMEAAAGQMQLLLSRNDIALAPVQVWELVSLAEVGPTSDGNGTHIDSFGVDGALPAATDDSRERKDSPPEVQTPLAKPFSPMLAGSQPVDANATSDMVGVLNETIAEYGSAGQRPGQAPGSGDLFVAYVDAEPERLAQLLDEFSNDEVVVSTRLDRPLDLRVVNSVVFDELPAQEALAKNSEGNFPDETTAEETTDRQRRTERGRRGEPNSGGATTLPELPVAATSEPQTPASATPTGLLYSEGSPGASRSSLGAALSAGETTQLEAMESNEPVQNPEDWQKSQFAWQARQVVNFYHVTAPQQSLPNSERENRLSEVELLTALSDLPVSALSPANQEITVAQGTLDAIRQQAPRDSVLLSARSAPPLQSASDGVEASLPMSPDVQSTHADVVAQVPRAADTADPLTVTHDSISAAWGPPGEQGAIPLLQRSQPHNSAVANWLYRSPAVSDRLAGENGRSYQRGVSNTRTEKALFSKAPSVPVAPLAAVQERLYRSHDSGHDTPGQPTPPAGASMGLQPGSVTQSMLPSLGEAAWGEVGSRYVMQSRSSQRWQSPPNGSQFTPLPAIAASPRSAAAYSDSPNRPAPQGPGVTQPGATHARGAASSPAASSAGSTVPDSIARTRLGRSMLPDTLSAAEENETATLVNSPAASPVLAGPSAPPAPSGGVRILVVLQRATLP